LYSKGVPKLWTATVETHRHEVRDAILAAAGDVVRRRGLLALTMSEIAAAAGVGRATLYKYFADVEEILDAWHHQQVTTHLAELTELSERPGNAADRLRSVLRAYGQIAQHRRHGGEQLAAALHRDGRLGDAEQKLHDLVAGLIGAAAAEDGVVRSDVPADELAAYCIGALSAVGPTGPAGVDRLLAVTWSGLTTGA
jgi:AcrR family transcriptional regulator